MQTGIVTIIGSYNVGLFYKADRLPQIGETVIGQEFWESGGGKGSNQAVAASVLEARTRFIARIGNDRYGADALRMYERLGVSTDLIQVDSDSHTGISVIFVDKDGRNMIVVVPGTNFRLSIEDIDRIEDHIATSSILGFQLENRLEVIDYAIRKSHGLGVRTLLDPAPAVQLPESLYPCIDYIKPNESEATVLTGISVCGIPTAMEAGRWLVARGVRVAIMTLGEMGAVVVTEQKAQHFQTLQVLPIDTTGAGDVFCGALMAALAAERPLDEAVTFANHAAALSVTRLGVINAIPRLEEVLDLQST